MSRKTVYYNSACPVCDAGIRYQRRKLAERAEEVDRIDVHANNEAASEVASSLEAVRERLHVVDEDGSVHVGSDAFAELWNETPGQQWLGGLARAPCVRPLSRWTYNGFARVLYWWNGGRGRW